MNVIDDDEFEPADFLDEEDEAEFDSSTEPTTWAEVWDLLSEAGELELSVPAASVKEVREKISQAKANANRRGKPDKRRIFSETSEKPDEEGKVTLALRLARPLATGAHSAPAKDSGLAALGVTLAKPVEFNDSRAKRAPAIKEES